MQLEQSGMARTRAVTVHATPRAPMSQADSAALAVGAVGLALLVGAKYGPRPDRPGTMAWYARLRKPGFTPSGQVIGLAWTGLGVVLAVAGYRVLQAPPGPRRRWALATWSLDVAAIGAWQWVFFGCRQLGASVATAVGMFACAWGFIVSAARLDVVSSVLGLPVAAWLGFAAVLDEEIWRRNRR